MSLVNKMDEICAVTSLAVASLLTSTNMLPQTGVKLMTLMNTRNILAYFDTAGVRRRSAKGNKK